MFMAPAPICAYNKFCNAVDMMDQTRSKNPTRRNERKISMSLLTFILDASCVNAFSIFNLMNFNLSGIRFREFKRRICEKLCEEQITSQEKKQKTEELSKCLSESLIINGLGIMDSNHVLLQNPTNNRVECFLCRFSKEKCKDVCTVCTKCKKGFV